MVAARYATRCIWILPTGRLRRSTDDKKLAFIIEILRRLLSVGSIHIHIGALRKAMRTQPYKLPDKSKFADFFQRKTGDFTNKFRR